MADSTTPAPACTRPAAPDRHGPKGPVPRALCPLGPRRPASTARAHAGTAAAESAISARRNLLQRPGVAVGVGEEDKATPGEVRDLADVDPALRQLGARVVGVPDDELQALDRSRRGVGKALA